MIVSLNLPELIFLHDSLSVYSREENSTLANLSSIASIGAPYDLVMKIIDAILDIKGDEDIYHIDKEKEISVEMNENELWIMSEICKSTIKQGNVDGLKLKLKIIKTLSLVHKKLDMEFESLGEERPIDYKAKLEEWKKKQEEK